MDSVQSFSRSPQLKFKGLKLNEKIGVFVTERTQTLHVLYNPQPIADVNGSTTGGISALMIDPRLVALGTTP